MFDYIIVGAGSAGCVLAHRLTEDPACKVLHRGQCLYNDNAQRVRVSM